VIVHAFPRQLIERLRFALARVCKSIRIAPGLVGLGRFDSDVSPADAFTRFASSGNVSALALHRLNVLARDRPDAPKQSAKPGTAGNHITTGPMERMRAIGRLS